ncbi:hypothetical protein [Actinomadura meridiana]|uniref:hypothetical protein n=1 Tax=Actinomadura meridiana TaxID=559626 RepID=UPI0031EC7180
MPSGADLPRVVIDETSFDFRELPPGQLSACLDRFNDVLDDLRAQGSSAHKPPCFESMSCDDELGLYEYLSSEPGQSVDRDIRNRFYTLVDRCPEWDAAVPETQNVSVDDGEPFEAWSVAYALTMVLGGIGVCCLVLAAHERRGFVSAAAAAEAEIYFFADSSELPPFWRSLFTLENVPEPDFFPLAQKAFPQLILHEELAFRRFQGGYRDLRALVVTHLAVLNDHFLGVYAERHGIAREVAMALAEHGCDGVSPESPGTRGNPAAMRHRDVEYAGKVVRCEWHMKLRPNVNRIHFAFGMELQPRILVGIFVDHLPT